MNGADVPCAFDANLDPSERRALARLLGKGLQLQHTSRPSSAHRAGCGMQPAWVFRDEWWDDSRSLSQEQFASVEVPIRDGVEYLLVGGGQASSDVPPYQRLPKRQSARLRGKSMMQ